MLLPPNTLQHPLAGKELPFRVPPADKQQEKAEQPNPGGAFQPPPHSLSHLRGLAEGMLHQELARVTLAASSPLVSSPPSAASPPAPSCHSTGKGIKERRAEKKRCGASPSRCRSPRHPPSPPDREKPTSPRAPPARGWECGSNCTWQGSNSESKTVVWLVSHPGPAALLFSFACLNPFQPRPLSPAGPAAPSPAVERCWVPGKSFVPPPTRPSPGMMGSSPA